MAPVLGGRKGADAGNSGGLWPMQGTKRNKKVNFSLITPLSSPGGSKERRASGRCRRLSSWGTFCAPPVRDHSGICEGRAPPANPHFFDPVRLVLLEAVEEGVAIDVAKVTSRAKRCSFLYRHRPLDGAEERQRDTEHGEVTSTAEHAGSYEGSAC